MDYDQHSGASAAGPIASQDWFVNNLENVLKLVPKDKLMCGIGAYGYDWVKKIGSSISVQDAWLTAHDSDADPEFDGDALNPHFAYRDEKNQRHDVWWLDAVTALNQMRAAQKLGINTFALWRLGSEDRSLWAVWDVPAEANAPDKLKAMLPGYDVDMEGSGEIIRIEQRPQKGERSLTVDAAGQITDENIDTLPLPYQVAQYGAQPKSVAITFDDGPDPTFTPKILDVLKAKGVKATFFLIGAQAQKDPTLTRRIYREGNDHRQSHLLSPRHQQHLQAVHEARAEHDGAAVCRQARDQAAAVPSTLLDRSGAGHGRPGAAAGDCAGHGLHHRRGQDRSQRLEGQSSPHRAADYRRRAGEPAAVFVR